MAIYMAIYVQSITDKLEGLMHLELGILSPDKKKVLDSILAPFAVNIGTGERLGIELHDVITLIQAALSAGYNQGYQAGTDVIAEYSDSGDL